MASEHKWIPPLPPGWEARYDPNQKAFFFIDHQNRVTQWEDPRFHRAAPPASHPPPQHNSAAAAAAESSLTSEANKAVIDKLKNDYPGAPRELIGDMFSLCHYNERETREQLDDLGFAGSRKSSAHASPQHGATSNESSPHRHAHSQQHHEHHHNKKKQQPKKESSPAKELSEAQKHRLLDQLKHDFPKSDAAVVKIALESCKYNLADAKTLIAAWEKKVGSKNGASSSAREDRVSTSSPAASSRPTSPPSQTLEPAGLADTAAMKPQGLSSAQQNAYRPGFHPSPKKTTIAAPKTNASASTSGRDAGGTKTACPQHARAKQVTRPKQPRTTTQVPASSLTPPHAQGQVAQRSKVTSEYRTQPKGPDPSLRHGPDSALLTSDYTQANGPDRSLRVGPDRSRLTGPQGALGPDVTLRCGPQNTLLQDNRNNSYERIASPSGILVSNI